MKRYSSTSLHVLFLTAFVVRVNRTEMTSDGAMSLWAGRHKKTLKPGNLTMKELRLLNLHVENFTTCNCSISDSLSQQHPQPNPDQSDVQPDKSKPKQPKGKIKRDISDVPTTKQPNQLSGEKKQHKKKKKVGGNKTVTFLAIGNKSARTGRLVLTLMLKIGRNARDLQEALRVIGNNANVCRNGSQASLLCVFSRFSFGE